jgi:hypothetical protein
MPKKPKRVREQVMVYLEPRDRSLLEALVEKTGLPRTELLRRGLWQLASRTLSDTKPGSAFEYLVETASDADVPRDLSEHPDHYLYGGGYEQWFAKRAKPAAKRKRAGLR